MSGSVNGRNVLNVEFGIIPVVEVIEVLHSGEEFPGLQVGGTVDVGLVVVVVKSKFIGGRVESVMRESEVGVAGEVVGSGDMTSGDVPPEVGVEVVVAVVFDSDKVEDRGQGGVVESVVVELFPVGSVDRVVVNGVLSSMLEVELLEVVDSGLVGVECVPSVGKVIIA